MPSTNIGQHGPFAKRNRSAFANFLRAKREMYDGTVRVSTYPYHLLVEASDVCQLRCPTCVTGIENEMKRRRDADAVVFRDERKKLSPALFRSLLDEVGEYLFMVMFYNFGEPFLNRDLPTLIAMAKNYDIETDVNSNLSLPLSDDQIEAVLSSGLDYLFASVDGFTQESYQVHRVGGDIAQVKRNLGRIAATRDRLGVDTIITFNMLIFSHNEGEVTEAQEFCDDLGINFNVRDAFIHNPEWLPSYRQLEEPRDVPSDVALPRGFQYRDGGKTMVWSPLPEVAGLPSSRCSWHYGYTVISAGGHVSPCCAVPSQKDDFGRLGPGVGRFAEVWNNDALLASRASFAGKADEAPPGVETICTKCPLPPFMYQLYSLHDFKVMAQYDRAIGAVDPALHRGFELLARARYGVGLDELFPNGTFSLPPQMLELENVDAAAAFMSYYDEHLADEKPFLADAGHRREFFLKLVQ